MSRASCTKDCERMPVCEVCGRRKKPLGRSEPAEGAGGLCGPDCSGYYLEPTPGHLWPGELDEVAP